MSYGIKESDWKLLRQIYRVPLERLCQRILKEIDAVSADSTKTYHQRYLEIFDIIQRRNKDIAMAFDNMRRSTALTQLAIIYSKGLLTQEEFLRFSQETRSIVEMPQRGRRVFFEGTETDDHSR